MEIIVSSLYWNDQLVFCQIASTRLIVLRHLKATGLTINLLYIKNVKKEEY